MKIAKIISTKQIVVNSGKDDGLKVGDRLEIIDKFGTEPVIDPDTGENLGTLDVSKGIVYVSKVYPKMAIADAPSHHVDSTLSANFSPKQQLSGILRSASSIYGFDEQDDLNVDPNQITGDLPTDDMKPIRVGDIVIKRPKYDY